MDNIFDDVFNSNELDNKPADKGPRVFTISELNAIIKGVISNAFPSYVWIRGEIQDLKISAKRNIYFNLVQKNEKGTDVLAQMQAFIFDNIRPKLEKRLNTTDISSFLKKDIEVKLLCKVQFYQKSARCSLTVFDIDPAFSLGQMAINKEKLIQQLKLEGLLNKNKQAYLPLLPLNIGLVTAYDTAAFHDFTDELKKSAYPFNVKVFDAHMQGANVERDVLKALKLFSKLDQLDLVVITRGGGSTADLSFFDSEKIARAVANYHIPVLSAIGHQVNTSVLELTSYEQFKTPTKVSNFLISRIDEYLRNVDQAKDIVLEKSIEIIDKKKNQLQLAAVTVSQLSGKIFGHQKEILNDYKSKLLTSSIELLNDAKSKLTLFVEKLSSDTRYALNNEKHTIASIEKEVKLLDPINVLKRGFSITMAGADVLKDADQLQKDDIIHTVLYNGTIDSLVVSQEMGTHPSVFAAKEEKQRTVGAHGVCPDNAKSVGADPCVCPVSEKVLAAEAPVRPKTKKSKVKNDENQLDLFDI